MPETTNEKLKIPEFITEDLLLVYKNSGITLVEYNEQSESENF